MLRRRPLRAAEPPGPVPGTTEGPFVAQLGAQAGLMAMLKPRVNSPEASTCNRDCKLDFGALTSARSAAMTAAGVVLAKAANALSHLAIGAAPRRARQ